MNNREKFENYLKEHYYVENLNDDPGRYFDNLDYIEVIMEFEMQFDCVVNENENESIQDFNTFTDLLDWLFKFENNTEL